MQTYEHPCLETKGRPTIRSFSKAGEALDDATIADLSATKISHMTDDELVRVIRAARLPKFNTASSANLELYDSSTLVRLACLARHCCRNRVTSNMRLALVPGAK